MKLRGAEQLPTTTFLLIIILSFRRTEKKSVTLQRTSKLC